MRSFVFYFSVLVFLFVTNIVTTSAQVLSVQKLREGFSEAVSSEVAAEAFLKKLEESTTNDAYMLAYRGGAEAIKAKNSYNPYTKIKYLKRSQESLKAAIDKKPKDAEIRFLRFSVQHFVPAFLGFSNELEEDKKYIIAHLRSAPEHVKEAIIKFMLESGRCNKEERAILENLQHEIHLSAN